MKKAPCKTDIKVSRGAAVKDVVASAKALTFVNAAGISFRLTFEGIHGWRLQSSNNGKFDDMGACQMLAQFMGEQLGGKAQKLTVVANKNSVTLTEKKGTCAVLSLGKAFSLQFCTPAGKVITELTDIAYVGKRTIVKGTLESGEAIYGGGERLDALNKRGSAFELRTCDGWNNSSTTYVVIPTFLTTRGGGMFFNRNEAANVDFGKEVENEWFYSVRESEIDCYFYPTGSMADVLKGYTELAGHAYMPTPWMQGMHLCRYTPDFCWFEKDYKYESLEAVENWQDLFVASGKEYVSVTTLDETARAAEKIYFEKKEDGSFVRKYVRNDAGELMNSGPKGNPGGSSCKTIMTNYINADMKPEAASMEAREWARCFEDTDESRANKEDLRQSIKWLHDHGMRAMVYIRVGGIYDTTIGYKDEYRVHADVEVTNADGTVTLRENTTGIPWILGTGDNPDVVRGSDDIKTADYLDITNEEAVDWYFGKIWGEMIEMGMDGVKIDFCEVMPEGEKQIGITKTHYKWKKPELIAPGTEHHAYPVYFISAFYKKMIDLKAEKGLKDGFMVFVRGGGIGSQRNPYMWSGDQSRDYVKLDDQLFATVNCGLSGLPYMSFDMSGYAYYRTDYHKIGKEKESAVFVRGLEFTTFLTQMQTHGDVRHAYEMTEDAQQIYRNYTRLHTELIPYMQKYSKIACDTGMPPVRHLVLNYQSDANVYNVEDEFLLGEGLLVAPILSEETFERDVYLPAGEWIDLLTGETLEGGKTVHAKANIGQIPVYLNNSSGDAAELKPIFDGINWYNIKHWQA